MYRVNKRKDFRDKHEQDRTPYNFETHIVKDAVLIILSCAEECEAFGTLSTTIFTAIQQTTFAKGAIFLKHNKTCTPFQLIGSFGKNDNPRYIIEYNLENIQDAILPIGSVIFLLLLSFLTEYLSKRNLHHSYIKSIYKHLSLFVTQTTVIYFLSNAGIHVLSLFIAPILVLIDWCILVRNSRKLRNVLK